MTFATVQQQTFGRLNSAARARVSDNPAQAAQVLKACLTAIGKVGSTRAARNPRLVDAEARKSLGISGILASLFGPIILDMAKQLLVKLLADLMPALIEWLQQQLSNLHFTGGTSLDQVCLELGAE